MRNRSALKPLTFVWIAALAVALIAGGAVGILRARADAAADKILDIQEVISPGGITAWLVQDPGLPMFTMRLAFRGAGSVLETPEKQGTARLLSNTLDEGAGEWDSQSFQKLLADNSISLGFSSSRDDFGATLKTLSRNKGLAFKMLQAALTAPHFEADAVARMRAANLARIKSSLSDPEWMAARLINDVAFEGHPYALNSGGTLTSLTDLDADDLRSFMPNLARDRLLVTVAGDITQEELKKILDETFGALPAHGPNVEVSESAVQSGGSIVHYRKDIPQTIIEIMQPGIGRDDPDWYAFQVMNYILGAGGFGSRLTKEIREKRGLTYGVFSQPFLLDHLKALNISLSTDNKNAGEALALIRQELQKMRDTTVSDKELTDAKAYITGSLAISLTSTEAIADTMMSLRMDDLPMDYLDRMKEKINAITAADIQKVAQRILQPDNLTVVMVGQPESVTVTRTVEKLPNVE